MERQDIIQDPGLKVRRLESDMTLDTPAAYRHTVDEITDPECYGWTCPRCGQMMLKYFGLECDECGLDASDYMEWRIQDDDR